MEPIKRYQGSSVHRWADYEEWCKDEDVSLLEARVQELDEHVEWCNAQLDIDKKHCEKLEKRIKELEHELMGD